MYYFKRILIVVAIGASSFAANAADGAQLLVGAASADITPDEPVPLTGFRTVRISKGIHSRCTANVLALESRDGDKVLDQAILVSCDLCVIRPGIQQGFRRHVAERLPGFDVNKLFLAATHTHAAPVLLQNRYQSYGDAMQPKDYVQFMNGRIAEHNDVKDVIIHEGSRGFKEIRPVVTGVVAGDDYVTARQGG